MQKLVHTDVLILGGGPAGIAAAVAAAQKGLRVSLVERNAYLGGKATAAEVGTVCGLYKFSKQEESEYIVKGFPREFAEQLRNASATGPLHNRMGLHYLPYHISSFKTICESLLEQYRVTVYYNSIPYKVDLQEDRVQALFINENGKEVQFVLGSIIDCSGESIVSQLTDSPTLRSEHYQAAAQVFTLCNVHEDCETRLGMILLKELKSGINNKLLDHYFDRVYVVQGSLRKGRVSLKLGLPLPVTHTHDNLESLQKMARSFVEGLTAYLVQHVPVFKDAEIEHVAPEVGIRVGLRTLGRYILTEEDVLGCKKFADAIANASWPIEEWELDKRVKMRYFPLEEHYQIPASCLQSEAIANLFVAGRNISATNGAIASARVMGICLQTGFAAGSLAAALVMGIPDKEMIESIQHAQL